jgi:general secretion pathway protein G
MLSEHPPAPTRSDVQPVAAAHPGRARAARFARLHRLTRRGGAACHAGSSLIELMVVMSLIVILATMGLVQYRQSVTRAREAVLKEDLFRLRDAIDQYYADKNKYPETLGALVTEGYLRGLPEDPFTRSSTTWQEVPAEPDPANPVVAPGVYDVKSGSDGTALDGSRYADW